MKIIFMTSNPFIEQQKIDMYVDAISSKYAVTLWDLSRIYGRNEQVSNVVEEANKVQTIEEFKTRLNNEVKTDQVQVITNITIPQLKKINCIIKQLHINIININKEGLAAWLGDSASAQNSKGQPVKTRIKYGLRQIDFIRALYNGIKYPGVKYDYLLSSYNFYPEESRQFVKIHQIKYDEYLNARTSDSIIDGKYILFIDAALCNHPMFQNAINQLDRHKYLESLNRYFDKLEQTYGIPVVISSHPKANYQENNFGGRKIIKYKTPILIQHADKIVSHYSTSLIDAVLLKKPIKVMYSKELLASSCRYCVMMGIKFAEMLNSDTVNLDDPKIVDFNFDEQSYKRFINSYVIISEKANMSNREIVLEFLESLAH